MIEKLLHIFPVGEILEVLEANEVQRPVTIRYVFSSAQGCARLTLLCAKTRGFSYTVPPKFFTSKLADFALYKTRILTKSFGIFFFN
jgi:hypothetical protein